MTHDAFSSSRKLFLSLAMAAGIVCGAGQALAAAVAPSVPIESCDPKVKTAMQAKAQALKAYDRAITTQFIDKPDSVLALTCFNRQASVSAVKGGCIFSEITDFSKNKGDAGRCRDDGFIGKLSPLVTPVLSSAYPQFAGAYGFDSGQLTTEYAGTGLNKSYASLAPSDFCNGMQKLWDTFKKEGVDADVPYATFDDLLSGSVPGGGANFTASITKDKPVFDALKAANNALPTPVVPDYSGANSASSCAVLAQAGITC